MTQAIIDAIRTRLESGLDAEEKRMTTDTDYGRDYFTALHESNVADMQERFVTYCADNAQTLTAMLEDMGCELPAMSFSAIVDKHLKKMMQDVLNDCEPESGHRMDYASEKNGFVVDSWVLEELEIAIPDDAFDDITDDAAQINAAMQALSDEFCLRGGCSQWYAYVATDACWHAVYSNESICRSLDWLLTYE